MDQLEQESQLTRGRPMPKSLQQISIGEAITWQFYERGAVITQDGFGTEVSTMEVDSKTSSKQSHFGISMFGRSGSDLEDFEPLTKLAHDMQPLLDWLANNHHDFMRLNDFSEAFSLLRWLARSEVALAVVDLNGEGRSIATPNHVILGKGPGLQTALQ